MIRAIATLVLLTLAAPLAGCVVAGPGYGPGFCNVHPNAWRCR